MSTIVQNTLFLFKSLRSATLQSIITFLNKHIVCKYKSTTIKDRAVLPVCEWKSITMERENCPRLHFQKRNLNSLMWFLNFNINSWFPLRWYWALFTPGVGVRPRQRSPEVQQGQVINALQVRQWISGAVHRKLKWMKETIIRGKLSLQSLALLNILTV